MFAISVRLDEMLSLVQRGESIELTQASVAIARLVPVTNPQTDNEGDLLARPSARFDAALLGDPIPCSGDIVRAVIEDRDER